MALSTATVFKRTYFWIFVSDVVCASFPFLLVCSGQLILSCVSFKFIVFFSFEPSNSNAQFSGLLVLSVSRRPNSFVFATITRVSSELRGDQWKHMWRELRHSRIIGNTRGPIKCIRIVEIKYVRKIILACLVSYAIWSLFFCDSHSNEHFNWT